MLVEELQRKDIFCSKVTIVTKFVIVWLTWGLEKTQLKFSSA